jgi:cysteinyl-tRNA synthetase
MKLYNSLTKQIEDFVPINSDSVGIYSCGPTVYNNLHIGNISAFIYADVLRRSLEVNGFSVKHVMNITDVDDKTIRDSLINYPEDEPKIALNKLTAKYRDIFLDDMKKTGINTEIIEFISAVDTIPEMIKLVQKLLDNKIAYIADDGVYFSITKYYQAGYKYGLLQKVETQQSKARVANDEYDKESAGDFALWKRGVQGEPAWPAKFSEDLMVTDMPGRPGWHIECSAMSEKTLGTPFDLHTGGIDLKFPHHENEIAQSCGAGSTKLANYFFHNNHVLVDGKKMSKSLGNVFTLRDLENKKFKPMSFRLLVLESHYHSESNFSWDILSAASNRYQNWINISETCWQIKESDDESLIETLNSNLADNVNTPQALKNIDEYFETIVNSKLSPNKKVLIHIKDALGIDLETKDISNEIKEIIKKRSDARKNKNWELSDKLRDNLLNQGIRIRDELDLQIWSRI